uniref:Chromosome 11 open reading frame 97 n=1 Tax=Nothoprocta perdicaria TaxID=30464 RepID=A0A8C6ZKZ2_NOTPE
RGFPRDVSMAPARGAGTARDSRETRPAQSAPRSPARPGGERWKTFVYVEPSRRVKEILEEELCFRKEECHIKHPAAVALEGIWSVKKNFSMGGLKPAAQNRNSLLLQPKLYSRHEGMKSKSQ